MVSPWNGPRHRSWASNSVVASIALALLLSITLVVDYFGEPPTYLTGLLGTAAGAFFTALGSDKAKRDADVRRHVDDLDRRVGEGSSRADNAERRIDDAERRESGWSRHRDHHDEDDDSVDGGGR